ncbi:MAG: 50S ribosomal protein L15 [Candidatus Brennerbacteria bacterium]|nr:50S ribosomal protein L15 [Candidatus Brennerbacteria bacterium]
MQIHEIRNPNKKKRKRVGRGGKRGTTSGRGQKGQKARAGHRIRPALRDLLIRIPKLRGVKHKSIRQKPAVLNVGELARFAEGGLLNREVLLKKKLIKKANQPVKILGEGELKGVLTVEGLSVSAKAKGKILAAGGTIK